MKKLFLPIIFLIPMILSAMSYDSGGGGAQNMSVTMGNGLTGSLVNAHLSISAVTDVFSASASGSSYSFTSSSALLDFGTVDPVVNLTEPGTYLVLAKVNARYNAATYLGLQSLTLKVRRTNNSANDLSSTIIQCRILTLLTDNLFNGLVTPFVYTTTNSDDQLAIYGQVSGLPVAGSVDATEANIIAIRIL